MSYIPNKASSKQFAYRSLSLAVFAILSHQVWAAETADEPSVTLDTMKVVVDGKPKEQVGEKIVTRKELNEQNIQNAQDLVRYNTEVDVAEVGRYGNKGFAIRGVDGNRVAMNIDGVALPEVESNEIYSPYGYNYEGRFNPDLEMMGGVRIAAGADSLTSGSGAVGGSVSYMTKNPRDLLKYGNPIGGYAKVGYTNKNEELLTAAGLAAEYGNFEGIINYSRRVGHELKNHDMLDHNKERLHSLTWAKEHADSEFGIPSRNSSALYPDSMRYESDAVLGKLYYTLNDTHRFGLHGMYQNKDSFSQLTSKNAIGADARLAEDNEEMRMYGASYRYTPVDSKWLDNLALTYTHQEIKGTAHTYHKNADGSYWKYGTDYRPTTLDTDQLRLESKFLPLDLGKFGEHTFNLTANYNHTDYTSTKLMFQRTYDEDPNLVNDIIQKDAIPFPDAKKDNFNITLSDKIYLNDRFNALLGIRYDYYKYSPYFQNNTYWGYPLSSEMAYIDYCYTTKKCGYADSSTPITFYKDYMNGVYNNKPTYDKLTYGGQFEFAAIPDRVTARYKVGSGFLVPTITQMYSSFTGQRVQQIINTNVKPETSLNQELELEFNLDPVTLTLSAYRSDYKNFIHSKWWPEGNGAGARAHPDCGHATDTKVVDFCIMSTNLDDAKVEGYKIKLRSDLSRYLNGGDSMYFTAEYHTSKDEASYKADKEIDGTLTINTLASVPTTLMLGLDYHLPDDKATFHIRGRHLHGKKADDTKMVEVYYPEGSNSYRERVTTYQFIDWSKNAFVLDVYGTYKINNHLKLNAGIYNLTNEKYIPWDSLRQFATTNINSHVGSDGSGLNRYTAPGRNYALALTYEF